jgi:DNA polymerase-1
MYDLYLRYILPFGECLTEMEREGIKVDVEGHLPLVELKAKKDREVYVDRFIEWASKICPDAKYMNISSDAQKQQLLFAPCKNQIDVKKRKVREIKISEIATAYTPPTLPYSWILYRACVV